MKPTLLGKVLPLLLVLELGLSAVIAGEKSQEQLKSEAKSSEQVATATALSQVTHGKVKVSKLEEEDGRLLWSFEITIPHSRHIDKIELDAISGKIVSIRVEKPEDQARTVVPDTLEKKK